MRPGTYFEDLTTAECRQLIATEQIARVAYCQDGRPMIVPVNFVVFEDEVVVRTSYGGKLAAATHGAVMALEVDSVDWFTRTGRSVTVTGGSRLIENLDDLAALQTAPLVPWAPGDKEYFIGISMEEISGRRIRVIV